MTIKEYTNYMLNDYNKEVIEEYHDAKGTRKNRIKNQEKKENLKKITQNLFQLDNLTTELKIGPAYNCTDNPWIHIHDEKNKKATKGIYLGISFDKNTKSLEIWLGFGKTGMKKEEIKKAKNTIIQKLQTIEPDLKRNFNYKSIFIDATMISKSIPQQAIQESEIKKDFEYLATIYQTYNQKFNTTHATNSNTILKEQEENKNIEEDKIIEGRNILYKGFPGTGKSYTVKLLYLTKKDTQGNPIYDENNSPKLINNYKYETVVFYPEYTNTNFVGSILPVTENNIITYRFVQGPFTKILKKAITHPKTNFYLIIEEINRGNAPAIFGEIFLLLDRENHGNGRSTYEITNEFIAQEIYQNKDTKIYIPKNLSIIATMNSTDQNTTPLDSAFDRRWESIWITDAPGINDNLYIKGLSNITWGHFRTIINEKIKTMSTIIQTEDKKLGAYFIDQSYLSKEPTTNQKERLRFTYKVLTYLFINICQYDKQILFQENITCIDDLINEAKKSLSNIFNDEIKTKLKQENEHNSN